MAAELGDVKETETFNQLMDGEYKGVGISMVNYNDDIIVTGVFKNSPAAKAGVKMGDIITEVNGKSMEGKDTDEVIKTVKKNKKVEIKIKREAIKASLLLFNIISIFIEE